MGCFMPPGEQFHVRTGVSRSLNIKRTVIFTSGQCPTSLGNRDVSASRV
jgi:hypothetical protein